MSIRRRRPRRTRTAYHEAGHAVVALAVGGVVTSVSIVPDRGLGNRGHTYASVRGGAAAVDSGGNEVVSLVAGALVGAFFGLVSWATTSSGSITCSAQNRTATGSHNRRATPSPAGQSPFSTVLTIPLATRRRHARLGQAVLNLGKIVCNVSL
jgi:hypothetical protein